MPEDKTGIEGGSPGERPTPAQRLAVLGAPSERERPRAGPCPESAAAGEAPALAARIAELERLLAEARAAIDVVERRHRIDLALIESGAHDLETARLLTELAVASMEAPDVDAAVADLRRAKPFLFRAAPIAPPAAAAHAPDAGAMGGAPLEPAGAAARAADEAARTGSRAALLRYLRERRLAG